MSLNWTVAFKALRSFHFIKSMLPLWKKQNYTICQCPTECTEFGCTENTFNVAMMHENKCTCKYIQRICYSQAFAVDCTWTMMKNKWNRPPLTPDRPWMDGWVHSTHFPFSRNLFACETTDNKIFQMIASKQASKAVEMFAI